MNLPGAHGNDAVLCLLELWLTHALVHRCVRGNQTHLQCNLRMLDDYIGDRKEGFLLQTRSGKMLSPESFYRDGLKTIFKQMGRTRVRFNAFRRFRESALLRSECRQVLIDYWMGHENPDMGARYGRQLLEDVKYRKEWAEKVGLGFELPLVSEPPANTSCATCATNSAEQACSANA